MVALHSKTGVPICQFAGDDTFGHECGKPADWIGCRPSNLTRNGRFYFGRCDRCKPLKGRDNTGEIAWLPVSQYNPARHGNEFTL